jgi:hypothetical protein
VIVEPCCKYGHGPLTEESDKQARPQWSLLSTDGLPVIFAVMLFVCPVCGYIELFDDDPKRTTTPKDVPQ